MPAGLEAMICPLVPRIAWDGAYQRGDRTASCVWGSSMALDAMTPINLKDSVLYTDLY